MVDVYAPAEADMITFQYSLCRVVLMVEFNILCNAEVATEFQYSLCRVVLMVIQRMRTYAGHDEFQYSLCRVVLMVSQDGVYGDGRREVSVLALSSRFDGLGIFG